MFAQGFKPSSNKSASYPLLSTVHALSLQMAWIQLWPTTNGGFPFAGATGVWVSGANGIEVNSHALLRRSNWSQLGICSQHEELLQYRNPPLLTPAFPICRLIVLWQQKQPKSPLWSSPSADAMSECAIVCTHRALWFCPVWDIPFLHGSLPTHI